MTEIKITYYPAMCGFGGFCNGEYDRCEYYHEDFQSDTMCTRRYFNNNLCVYNRLVNNFEFDGIGPDLDYAFKVGKKWFTSENSDIVTLEVDGKMIIDFREDK